MKSGNEFMEVPKQLELAGHIFNEQEFEMACYIFDRLKNVNPNTVFQNRGGILGIGDPAKHLFCYYTINGGELLLKFKNRNPISPIDKDAISELIDKTIILFLNNDFTIRRNNALENKDKSEKQDIIEKPIVAGNDLAEFRIIDFFTNAERLELQKDENISIDIATFASVRLCNCLTRASKNSLGDILFMTKRQLFKLRNFGSKCFDELYDLIKTIANGAMLAPKNQRHYISAVELLNSDGNYYSYRQLISKLSDYDIELKKCDFKKDTFPFDSLGWHLCVIKGDLQSDERILQQLLPDIIISEYSSHKKEYPQLYKEISNVLEKFISTYLKEREGKILAERLGVNSQEVTLQTIADNIGLSRERIRQYEKHAKKTFNSKLQRTPIHIYGEIFGLKEKIISIGLGGFVFALIKFRRTNLAKYLMSSFFGDVELKTYHSIKQCVK